jgi:hypothetical protein
MVFECITDSDNQGKVPSGSIIDRDNQSSLSLIITTKQVTKAEVAHRRATLIWLKGQKLMF